MAKKSKSFGPQKPLNASASSTAAAAFNRVFPPLVASRYVPVAVADSQGTEKADRKLKSVMDSAKATSYFVGGASERSSRSNWRAAYQPR